MHPYLVKLGVSPEVQEFFSPWYLSGPSGGLLFQYKDGFEEYTMAYHRLPEVPGLWLAGQSCISLVRQVFISNAAMEIIAWMQLHRKSMGNLDNILFVATGDTLSASTLDWLQQNLRSKTCRLLFGNDLLGRVADVKVAAALSGLPVRVTLADIRLQLFFRHKEYFFDQAAFSLYIFEKRSGYRFGARTLKPKHHLSWLALLSAAAFNA